MSASVFPRISPEHDLCEAARQVNDYCDTHGLEGTLEWLDLDVGAGELAYLCEQRALRAVAASTLGIALGNGTVMDEEVARAIAETPFWRDMRTLIIGACMDGISIGWKARDLKSAT